MRYLVFRSGKQEDERHADHTIDDSGHEPAALNSRVSSPLLPLQPTHHPLSLNRHND